MKWVEWILPLLLLALFAAAMGRRIPVYDCFLRGAEKGLRLLWRVLPGLVSVLMMVALLEASGCMAKLEQLLSPVMGWIGLPGSITPLAVIRPFSGSAAMGVLQEIIQREGVDSTAGLTAQVILGSSETVFYTVTLYCGAAGVRRTRYLIPCALAAQVVVMIAAGFLVKWLAI